MSAIVLVLSMFVSPLGSTYAMTKGNKVSLNDVAVQSAKNKISSNLLKQFDSDEQVTFIVKLKDQVDSMTLAAETEKKLQAKKLTPAAAELAKRSTIINELKATAKQTQFNLLDFAEEQKAAGKVSDIKSYYIMNAVAITGTKDVMEKIASFPEVEKILNNEQRKVLNVDVMDAKITATEWGVDRVKAQEVWGMGFDGTGVLVGILDTGVQWNHPALMEKYYGYNAETGEVNHEGSFFDPYYNQTVAYDDNGHGTHVAGTILGSDANGTNQVGVAPGAKFIMAKAFDAEGYGYDEEILSAMQWIMEQGPDLVSNSWGGGSGIDETYRESVTNWRAAGIVPVFAAGNTDLFTPQVPGTVSSPGNFPESIAIGATDINDNLANFSLLGPSPYGEIKPDLAAPGVNIRSSLPGSSYGNASGTSMATPHVSGVIALLLAANGSLTVDQIEDILKNTARPLTNASYPDTPNNAFGWGLVDAKEAVMQVAAGFGTIAGTVTGDGEDTEAPTVEHEGVSETFQGMPINLEATVTDNISVVSVTVDYVSADGTSGSVAAEQVSGNYKSGTFAASIPGEAVQEGELTYIVKATDFGGNVTESDEVTVTVNPTPSVGYFQDFETDINGWQTYGENNTWEWGVPTSGPGAAFSGEKLFATNLDGQYVNNTYSVLEAPPIAVPQEGNTYLQFTHWYNFETNWDFGMVYVSDDGGATWTEEKEYTGVSNGYLTEQIDLSAYAGKTILITFDLDTDGSVLRDGWYIDDFKISDTSVATGTTATKPLSEKGEGNATYEGKKPSFEKQALKASVEAVTPMALPLQANVTVLETGITVNTNPATGGYSLMHADGDYTVLAEAYGFYPSEQSVTVTDGGITEANFNLEEKPKATISGTVSNSQTGEPVEGASVYLVEDSNVPPVTTDENGNYSITGYLGEYTVKVVAPLYNGEEITINLENDSTIDVQLDPFIGYPGQMGYDDGTAENAIAWNAADNGFAVKMSLANGAERALVTGGQFMFWTTDWPNPGGTEFQVAVYDASGENGAPGELVAGPFNATALRDGNWTNVDLSDKGIVVDGDFYMVYIQSQPNPYTPGIAIDESSPLQQGRSWEYFGGVFTEITGSSDFPGNYMIRATVEYAVDTPVLTSPADGSHTNVETASVEGFTNPGQTVEVFKNGEVAAETTSSEDGSFAVDVALTEGQNTLSARVTTERGYSDTSNEITVTLDTAAPDLSITSPGNGQLITGEAVTVTGPVADTHLGSVTVNGIPATVNNGIFTAKIIVDEGDFDINVVATDLAGNVSSQSVTVDVDYTAPVIENVKPETDKTVNTGETVLIEFDSEEGLQASFAIHAPLTNLSGDLIASSIKNVNDLPMTEVSPGHYVAYFTVPANLVALGAQVEVKAVDDHGHETRQMAAGKLFINDNTGDDDKPGKGKPGKGKGNNNGKGNGNK